MAQADGHACTETCPRCRNPMRRIKRKRPPHRGARFVSFLVGCVPCGRSLGVLTNELVPVPKAPELVNCNCVAGAPDEPCPLHPGTIE